MEIVVFLLIISYFAMVKVKPFTPEATIRLARIIALVMAVLLFIIANDKAPMTVQYNAMGFGALIISILTPMFVIEIKPE